MKNKIRWPNVCFVDLLQVVNIKGQGGTSHWMFFLIDFRDTSFTGCHKHRYKKYYLISSAPFIITFCEITIRNRNTGSIKNCLCQLKVQCLGRNGGGSQCVPDLLSTFEGWSCVPELISLASQLTFREGDVWFPPNSLMAEWLIFPQATCKHTGSVWQDLPPTHVYTAPMTHVPELGRDTVPDDSSIGPLPLLVIPIQPPIVFTFYSSSFLTNIYKTY